jgi:orotidine-5'-phosphate decarboxylase
VSSRRIEQETLLYLEIADTLPPQMGAQARYSQKLAARIAATGSNLCVGLDPRIEQHGGEIGQVEAFLDRVIEATLAKTAVYKPNSAYFEAMGPDGIALLKRVIARVPEGVPVILDAKRSDIGETQRRYAQACYEVLGADAVTLNPFMGYDSLEPFLDFEGKGIYLLAVTSNPGSADLQRREAEGRKIFEYVGEFASRAAEEVRATDVGLVVGLTNAGEDVIAGLPDVPLLIPGLGAQGGDLSTLKGTGRAAPNVVNVSRGVIYGDVADSIGGCAEHYSDEIAAALA